MSSADDTRTRNGESLTLTWPQPDVALVTMIREREMNTLSLELLGELDEALTASVDGGARALVITGQGRAFCAGAHLRYFTEGDARIGAGSFALRDRYLQPIATVFDRIETLPIPVIAAINGFALGGGCELALACHIRLAADNAKFGQPEVKLGIAPGYGGTQRLPRIVGKGIALELILTGRMIDAQEALRIGLVNKVLPAAELANEARQMMKTILAMGPRAVELSLEAVDQGLDMTLEEGLNLEANHFGLLAATQDMREGMAAFLETRDAKFSGH